MHSRDLRLRSWHCANPVGAASLNREATFNKWLFYLGQDWGSHPHFVAPVWPMAAGLLRFAAG
jgi:hypothetical protein